MCDQELEFHVRKLEMAFNAATRSRQEGMKPGIECMIRLIKLKDQSLPLSLRRMQRQIEKDNQEDFFDNMPV